MSIKFAFNCNKTQTANLPGLKFKDDRKDNRKIPKNVPKYLESF